MIKLIPKKMSRLQNATEFVDEPHCLIKYNKDLVIVSDDAVVLFPPLAPSPRTAADNHFTMAAIANHLTRSHPKCRRLKAASIPIFPSST